jgi:hypothetical protein
VWLINPDHGPETGFFFSFAWYVTVCSRCTQAGGREPGSRASPCRSVHDSSAPSRVFATVQKFNPFRKFCDGCWTVFLLLHVHRESVTIGRDDDPGPCRGCTGGALSPCHDVPSVTRTLSDMFAWMILAPVTVREVRSRPGRQGHQGLRPFQ